MITPHTLTNGQLTSQQVDEWRQTGCVVVNNLIPSDMIRSACSQLDSVFSSGLDSLKAGTWDFGSKGKMEFPCKYDIFNQITIHPNILKAITNLLNDKEILLVQSDIWPKYGQESSISQIDNNDQRIHMDYGNNMLVHPSEWNKPEAVSMIIYYSDESECGGSTAVVQREGDNDIPYKPPYIHMPGISTIPWFNDKTHSEDYLKKHFSKTYELRNELYKREKKIRYTKGTILFYRLDTWHRGTPVNNNKLRYIHNLVFKKKSATWILNWNYSIARSFYLPSYVAENIIINATVDQRNCLGFPPPGDAYWTTYTLKMVAERYKGSSFNITPYLITLPINNEHTPPKPDIQID